MNFEFKTKPLKCRRLGKLNHCKFIITSNKVENVLSYNLLAHIINLKILICLYPIITCSYSSHTIVVTFDINRNNIQVFYSPKIPQKSIYGESV